MTPEDFRAALDTLGVSADWVARQCNRAGTTGRAWGAGRQAVPLPVAAWLKRRVRDMRADPPPALPARGDTGQVSERRKDAT